MTEPAVFEICFPSHISRAPVCRPGQTIAGAVVLKLSSPLVASHLMLRFYGIERVRRTPVSTRTEATEKKQQQTTVGQKMIMDKEFFRQELLLWGERKVGSLRVIPCNTAHRFHFSFTMPYVNMPTPRQTPDVEISYLLEASLATEFFDHQRDEKVLRDMHKTATRCFQFEPVIQQRISHGLAASAPLESIIELKDAALLNFGSTTGAGGNSDAGSDPRSSSSTISASSILSFHNAGKTHMNLHVFHPTPAYLPGETVELLILAPANRKITHSSFQVRENVRCRKSSAPIIDESDVPILWKYSVDLTEPQDIHFTKLTKANISQDIGMLGRYLFTGHTSLSLGIQGDLSAGKHVDQSQRPPSIHSIGGKSSASIHSLNMQDSKPKGVEGLAITNLAADGPSQLKKQQHRVSVPLSPLTESQEIGHGSSSETLGTCASSIIGGAVGGMAHIGDNLVTPMSLSSSSSASYSASMVASAVAGSGIPGRSCVGSLGGMHSQQSYTQSIYSPTSPSNIQPQPLGPAPASLVSGAVLEHDDGISDRSSISETLSTRYQPTKSSLSANFSSLTRGSSTHNNMGVPKYNRLAITPVPLGGLLTKGSYKFAKISFTLPPIAEMSPVSSVFLDYEYTVDMSLSIGGSFGTTKKTAGRLPLKIVTVRTAAKASSESTVAASTANMTACTPNTVTSMLSGDSSGHTFSDTSDSSRSLRDSLSVLNLSISGSNKASPSSTNMSMGHSMHKGSPTNTLTEFQLDGGNATKYHSDGQLLDDSYPCLLSFIQNGEKIPIPELESIKIGSNLM
ncbi:hypothetical protein BX661DRAFT_182894 [Kickxella alabastrina]|uniref:uncharacterized protein n=1 Tax=Kickxella alabastrina TaxID=61397 RepID=UPI0022212602|nr:uncharacterized protein BX661DRAFT_182894 [Kickxella alabastrina]KAI7827231.1 hypothetical protein BX661DRAFT_182894 [Kickxella alabastrina]